MATKSEETTFAYSYAGEVVAAGAVLPAVGIIMTALRFLARRGQKSGLGLDDWLILPALLSVIGMGVCLIYGAKKGVMGYATPPATSNDPAAQETQYLPGQQLLEQLEYAFLCLSIFGWGFVKLSVIAFYRRIFVTGRNTFDIISKVTAVIVVCWTIAFFLVQVFGCGSHFEYNWGPLSDQAHCHAGLKFLVGLMISDFLTDLFVFLLPFPLIWRLHMRAARKVAVSGILLLGAMSLAASIARMVLQIQLYVGGYTTKTDVYLTITTILYWSMIESGVAIIALCLPTLHSVLNLPGVQSAVASVRSAISLHSLRSQQSRGSKGSGDKSKTAGPYSQMMTKEGSSTAAVDSAPILPELKGAPTNRAAHDHV